MNYGDFSDRHTVLERVVDRLGEAPSDFNERLGGIDWATKAGRGSAAAILLPLTFLSEREGFALALIRRSASVPQGGDLSCPGGIVDPLRDGLTGKLLSWLFPLFCNPRANLMIRERGRTFFRNVSFLLANALREAGEEVGLNPFRVTLLGTLPCYSLIMFARTMFPLVGFVRGNPRFRTNWEVDKVVSLPLKNFFSPENYGTCLVESEMNIPSQPGRSTWEFPCLIHRDRDGTEEVLWGATFYVVMSFLERVFDFDYARLGRSGRTVNKTLRLEYVTGTAFRNPPEQSLVKP